MKLEHISNDCPNKSSSIHWTHIVHLFLSDKLNQDETTRDEQVSGQNNPERNLCILLESCDVIHTARPGRNYYICDIKVCTFRLIEKHIM